MNLNTEQTFIKIIDKEVETLLARTGQKPHNLKTAELYKMKYEVAIKLLMELR